MPSPSLTNLFAAHLAPADYLTWPKDRQLAFIQGWIAAHAQAHANAPETPSNENPEPTQAETPEPVSKPADTISFYGVYMGDYYLGTFIGVSDLYVFYIIDEFRINGEINKADPFACKEDQLGQIIQIGKQSVRLHLMTSQIIRRHNGQG